MNLATLVLTATVATSSITSSRVDLFRDLVDAVELAQHLDADLDACRDELRIAEAEAPGVEEVFPGWLWPAVAVVIVASFGAGVAVAKR